MIRRLVLAFAVLALSRPSFAQQRPLLTEDPETIGAGRILIEGGVDYAHDQEFPVLGLSGNLWRVPSLGFSFGISSIAEFQIDGGFNQRLSITSRNPTAPLASEVTATGSSTRDFEDTFIGTKIRLLPEGTSRPAFGLRFTTKLPNASNASGLGTDAMDFYGSLLGAKTVQSFASSPTSARRFCRTQATGRTMPTYGVSFARAMTTEAELVGELNGRWSTRSEPFPGTESRSLLKLGGRYTRGAVRVDTAISFGLTTIDPAFGFTAGFTYVFNAFRVP
jgi:hypothetical protein